MKLTRHSFHELKPHDSVSWKQRKHGQHGLHDTRWRTEVTKSLGLTLRCSAVITIRFRGLYNALLCISRWLPIARCGSLRFNLGLRPLWGDFSRIPVD
ncbi:hypothetical protein JTB14_010386 [Gonioctena quinquepunctata]|nr:hypothetical protein JTB14_010386 [Gonioctena quinquepunctata]